MRVIQLSRPLLSEVFSRARSRERACRNFDLSQRRIKKMRCRLKRQARIIAPVDSLLHYRVMEIEHLVANPISRVRQYAILECRHARDASADLNQAQRSRRPSGVPLSRPSAPFALGRSRRTEGNIKFPPRFNYRGLCASRALGSFKRSSCSLAAFPRHVTAGDKPTRSWPSLPTSNPSPLISRRAGGAAVLHS